MRRGYGISRLISKRGIAAIISAIFILLLSQSVMAKVEIRFAFIGSDDLKKGIKEVIDSFNMINEDIMVIADPIPMEQDYTSSILAKDAKGTGPDVIYFYSDMVNALISRDLILDIDDFIEGENFSLDDYFSATLDTYTVNGKLYSLPIGSDIQVIGYNKDMFNTSGLEYPTEDWTWNDLVKMGQKLTKRTVGVKPQYGFAGFQSFYYLYETFLPVAWSNGGELFDKVDSPTRTNLTSKPVVDAVKFIRDLRFKYRIEPNEVYSTGEYYFALNMAAMAIVRCGIDRYIAGARSNFDWDVQIFPKGTKNRSGIARAVGVGIMKSSKNPEAAWEFVKYFSSSLGLMAFNSGVNGYGLYPPRNNDLKLYMMSNPNRNSILDKFVKTMSFGRIYHYKTPMGFYWEWPLILNLYSVYEGQIDPDQTLRQLKTQLDNDLRKANTRRR